MNVVTPKPRTVDEIVYWSKVNDENCWAWELIRTEHRAELNYDLVSYDAILTVEAGIVHVQSQRWPEHLTDTGITFAHKSRTYVYAFGDWTEPRQAHKLAKEFVKQVLDGLYDGDEYDCNNQADIG